MEKKNSRNKQGSRGRKQNQWREQEKGTEVDVPSQPPCADEKQLRQFQSVKRGIVYFMEFFIVVLFSSSSRASFVRHTCLLLAYSYVKKSKKTPSRRLVR